MKASSRPELFFIYGLIISAIVIVIFFTKIDQLSNMDGIIADYYANELSLIVDVIAARSGSMRIPFTISRLDDPNISLEDQRLSLSYVAGERGVRVFENRTVLPRVHGSVRNEYGAFVSDDHLVEVREGVPCSEDAMLNTTIGDPLQSDFVTIIVSDPSHGCVEFERIVSAREGSSDAEGFANVQRVIVDHTLDEVIIFAR